MPEYENLCAEFTYFDRLTALLKQFNEIINSVHEDLCKFDDAFMLLGLINDCLFNYFMEVRNI